MIVERPASKAIKSSRNILTPAQKQAHWKANDRTARSWEPRFRDAANRAFEQDKRELLAILSKNKVKALAGKATVDWRMVGEDWENYLSQAGENWRQAFIPVIQGLITDRAKQLSTAFGMAFDVQNLFARDWFNNYTLKFAQPIIKTTSDEISRLLDQGMIEGWSIPTMQNNLTTMFDQFMTGELSPSDFEWFADRMPPYRAEAIARTETMRASNASSEEIYREWGSQQKEWLSTQDNRTRTYDTGDFDHLEADGQVVGTDEPFIVSGEELMYPGDPNGSAGNVINCRCTVLPVIPD